MNEICVWNIDKLKKDMQLSLIRVICHGADYGGEINILLEADNIKVELIFKNYISYRFCDESILLSYWYSKGENLFGKTFFKVENSSFIEHMATLSYHFVAIGGEEGIEHYGIFLDDDCIEVISYSPPTINIIDH